jgi:hypothetical protein
MGHPQVRYTIRCFQGLFFLQRIHCTYTTWRMPILVLRPVWITEQSCLCQDSNSDPSAIQPIASRYTECAILSCPNSTYYVSPTATTMQCIKSTVAYLPRIRRHYIITFKTIYLSEVYSTLKTLFCLFKILPGMNPNGKTDFEIFVLTNSHSSLVRFPSFRNSWSEDVRIESVDTQPAETIISD